MQWYLFFLLNVMLLVIIDSHLALIVIIFNKNGYEIFNFVSGFHYC